MKNKKLFWICIGIWIVITLLRLLYHQPWYDEAHAYMLVQNYSFLDLISEMREEGHLMVWYLLIMPFAKLKLWYPYPMQILNWLFAFAALLIMWKKAPFHPVTKIIITFSYPFLAELPVVARCYAVGVVLLFLIASLYKNALKHPIWYAVLIALCANTSVMALFGASAFGFVFAYDLIKGALAGNVSKKDFRIAFSVLALSAVLVLWQIGGALTYEVYTRSHFVSNFTDFLYGWYAKHNIFCMKYLFTIITGVMMLMMAVVLYLKSRKLFCIYVFIFTGMLLCFALKYPGYSQHFIFFWIYTLLLCWLVFENKSSKSKLLIILEIILVLFFAIQIISKETELAGAVYRGLAKTMADNIKTLVAPNNSRIILTGTAYERIVPYFDEVNIELYSYNKALPVENCVLFDNSPIYIQLTNDNYVPKPSWLIRSIDFDKQNYVVIPMLIQGTEFLLTDNAASVKLRFVNRIGFDAALYEIIGNKNEK